MSDEAIVRLVIADSTAGARTTDTQSSTAGLSSSGVAGVSSAYNLSTRSIVDLGKGFSEALLPPTRVLSDIRDILDKDYDYSEKDYRESTTQTSLLKLIGAALSAEGAVAVGRELTKGAGIQSSDTQIILALNSVTGAVRELKLSLTPEAERKRYSLVGDALKGALFAVGLVELPKILKALGPSLASVPIPSGEEVAAVAAEVPPLAVVLAHEVMDAVANFPAETAALAVGAIAGGLLYLLSPKEKDKEKSVNELLADIFKVTEAQKDPLDQIAENTRLTANATSVTFETANKILALMPGHDPYAEFGGADALRVQESDRMGQPSTLEMAGAEGENVPLADMLDLEESAALPPFLNQTGQRLIGGATPAAEVEAAPFPTLAAHSAAVPIPQASYDEVMDDLMREVEQTATSTPDEYVPDTAYPEAEEIQTPVPDTAIPDPWSEWVPPLKGRGWNVDAGNIGEMISSGFRGADDYRNITNAEYQNYVTWRENQQPGTPGYGPPGFATGGAVGGSSGSDTIPAMLSPGEVVVPKKMVDSGAVDHLRGKLPGFAGGGLIGTTNRMMMGQMETDPATRIDRFGQGMSAVGDKLMSVGGSLGLVAGPLGAFAVGLGKAAEGVGQLMGVINETVDKYGEYNPQIAMAQAQVEINQTMGDMRRAQELGPDLAKFVVAQGELQQHFEEIKVKLLMQIVPAINNILEALNKVMGSGEGIGFAIELLTAPLTMIGIAARKLVDLQEDARIPEMEDPTNLILKSNIFDTSATGPGAGSSVPIR